MDWARGHTTQSALRLRGLAGQQQPGATPSEQSPSSRTRRRKTSDDPGPGQKYAIMARKHIAALRAKEPGVCIEIRWSPSCQGIEGNENADEWAKQAADEPDAHGVVWLDFKDPHGIVRKRRFPLPMPLANFKRNFSELKVRRPLTGSAERSPKQVTASTDQTKSKNRTPSWQALANASPPVFTNRRLAAA